MYEIYNFGYFFLRGKKETNRIEKRGYKLLSQNLNTYIYVYIYKTK